MAKRSRASRLPKAIAEQRYVGLINERLIMLSRPTTDIGPQGDHVTAVAANKELIVSLDGLSPEKVINKLLLALHNTEIFVNEAEEMFQKKSVKTKRKPPDLEALKQKYISHLTAIVPDEDFKTVEDALRAAGVRGPLLETTLAGLDMLNKQKYNTILIELSNAYVLMQARRKLATFPRVPGQEAPKEESELVKAAVKALREYDIIYAENPDSSADEIEDDVEAITDYMKDLFFYPRIMPGKEWNLKDKKQRKAWDEIVKKKFNAGTIPRDNDYDLLYLQTAIHIGTNLIGFEGLNNDLIREKITESFVRRVAADWNMDEDEIEPFLEKVEEYLSRRTLETEYEIILPPTLTAVRTPRTPIDLSKLPGRREVHERLSLSGKKALPSALTGVSGTSAGSPIANPQSAKQQSLRVEDKRAEESKRRAAGNRVLDPSLGRSPPPTKPADASALGRSPPPTKLADASASALQGRTRITDPTLSRAGMNVIGSVNTTPTLPQSEPPLKAGPPLKSGPPPKVAPSTEASAAKGTSRRKSALLFDAPRSGVLSGGSGTGPGRLSAFDTFDSMDDLSNKARIEAKQWYQKMKTKRMVTYKTGDISSIPSDKLESYASEIRRYQGDPVLANNGLAMYPFERDGAKAAFKQILQEIEIVQKARLRPFDRPA